ncbi:MAG: hypothetical protein IJT82_05745 [Schwartzia sp.]|nr:hypothetical protein [Schwartzia sp. (in: firmicutes)]
MDIIEQQMEGNRKRLFINALISVGTDFIVLAILINMGMTSGNWTTVIPVLIIMGVGIMSHEQTISFQMGYIPQYITDKIRGRTARDIIEEAAREAGINPMNIPMDMMKGPEGFKYLGEDNMYLYYVDRVYMFRKEDIAWIYFTGKRIMTSFFHWETFLVPHIALANGKLYHVFGYVFTNEEYMKLLDNQEELLPHVIIGYSDELKELYANHQNEFLAIKYTPAMSSSMTDAERASYLSTIDSMNVMPEQQSRAAAYKKWGLLLLALTIGAVVSYYVK